MAVDRGHQIANLRPAAEFGIVEAKGWGYDILMLPNGMSKRRKALVAIVLMLAVFALGLHVAAHWKGAYGDQICQACHAGHTAMPQPLALLVDQRATAVQRFVAAEAPAVAFARVCTHRIPRAPPA